MVIPERSVLYSLTIAALGADSRFGLFSHPPPPPPPPPPPSVVTEEWKDDNMFLDYGCDIVSYAPKSAVFQSCAGCRLGNSNNNHNNNSINRSNKHRHNRNLQGNVGDDDTSVAAPFQMIATTNKAEDGSVSLALQQPIAVSRSTGTTSVTDSRSCECSSSCLRTVHHNTI